MKMENVNNKEEEKSLIAENTTPIDTSKAVKAVVWYTFGSVLLKGIAFISTPIFTRLLSKSEYGAFSNITTWASLITIFATMELAASMMRARTEFKVDIHRFMFSLLPFGNLITGLMYIAACIFMDDVTKWLSIDSIYIHMIFISLLFTPATTIIMTHLKYRYKYKLSTLISIGSPVLNTAVSLILVLSLENKLLGRSVGYFIVPTIVGLICYIYLFVSGKGIKISYWKYAIKISFPLTLHLLSMYILSQSDRIMITKICGEEQNALYSLAYSCGVVLSFLWSALNSAFSPIICDALDTNDYHYTQKMTLPYLAVYIVPTFMLMLLGPELVYIMGGEPYMEAKSVMPPIVVGSILQYMYTLYVNIEQYEKKTWGVAVGTTIAGLANIVLNAWLIPIFGYIAAAYTTLFCYILLFVIHFLLVKRMKRDKFYNTKIVFGFALLAILFSFASQILYSFMIVRYIISAVYIVLILIAIIKKKNAIIGLFKSNKKHS